MLKTIKMPADFRYLKRYLPAKNYSALKTIKYSKE